MSPLKISRKKKENPHSLVRRFKKAVQESGILIRKRKKRYKHRAKSEGGKKRAALRKAKVRKKYEKLKKLGKLKTHR
jgi:hypothetical protein